MSVVPLTLLVMMPTNEALLDSSLDKSSARLQSCYHAGEAPCGAKLPQHTRTHAPLAPCDGLKSRMTVLVPTDSVGLYVVPNLQRHGSK